MHFIDLNSQQAIIREDIEKNIKKVLDHGRYIMGPEVFELEEKLANYVGVKHCISVSSGTDALQIAMMALGVKAGDEVITTPFSFIATAETIALLGAKPVYVDIDSNTYNINHARIEEAITDKTKAIVPVSLFGQCADFDQINDIARKYDLPVIEDGAQSFGATYKGKKSCGLTTIGCTSFFPSKPLGGYGDGGACFTNNDELAVAMREIRVHGQDRRYHHSRLGLNGRLDTIQAAILLAKLKIFPQEVVQRIAAGSAYTKMLSNELNLVTPAIAMENQSVFAQYTILLNNRDEIQQHLTDCCIPTAVHYPTLLPNQPALAHSASALPTAEKICAGVMSLPMHPYLKHEEIVRVSEKVIEAVGRFG